MDIWGVLGPTLATVATSAVTALITRQAKKINIDIDEKQQQQIKNLVFESVIRVEEMARRNPTMTGEDKRAAVVADVAEQAPKVERSKVESLIDSALPLVRSKGIIAKPPAPFPVFTMPASPTQ